MASHDSTNCLTVDSRNRFEPGTSRLHSRWGMLLAAGLIVAAGLGAYANTFQGPFIYDDHVAITDNPTIRQLWPLGPSLSPPCDNRSVTSRPLLNLSLAINYRLGGLNVWGYHATNLAIHLINGLLLLGILRRTFHLPALRASNGEAAWGLALAVALLWTVHPLQTESVTYIIQRAESLAGLFYLLTLYSVIRGAQSSRRAAWYAVAVGACFLGVGCKEIVSTAPVFVLLYDRTFLEDSFGKALRRRWGLYAGLCLCWVFQLFLLARTGLPTLKEEVGPVGMWAYARSEPGVILHYLRLSFWPHPLCLGYEWPVAHTLADILPGLLAVGLLGTATVWGLMGRRGWGILGVWFFLILAPTSSIMPLPQLAFEHRMYLPLAAVLTMVVAGGFVAGRHLVSMRWINGRVCLAAGMCLAVLAAVVLGVLTFQRNKVYQSPLSIWGDTVAKAPHNPYAQSDLASALSQAGRKAEALEHYEEAVRLKPDYAMAHCNLGVALRGSGRVSEAIEHYEEALRLKPRYAECHSNLAVALRSVGRVSEAIEHYEEALRLQPDSATVHNNLGFALAGIGRLPEAIEHYEQAIRLQPDSVVIQTNLSTALANAGRVSEAIEHYEQVIRLKPDNAELRYNLCVALMKSGHLSEAIKFGKEAVRGLPNEPEANRFVAWLMATHESAQGGDPEQAVELAQRACLLTGRRDIACLDTLAAAYASAGRFSDAVAMAKEAWQIAEAAGQSAAAEEIHIRLQLYRDRKAYREPTVTPAGSQP